MQFSCNQDTFAKHLGVISRVVSSKPGLPILSNVLFESSNGKLSMTATDLEIGLHCWIGAQVKSEGKITVPAKQISEFINSIPAERVDVTLDKNILDISTVNNNAQFNTIPSDDYPGVAAVTNEQPILELSTEEILTAVGRVAFSAAHDDIKPVLTGIRIEIQNNIVAFVSADGLRLSRQVIELKKNTKQERNLLVPAKAMVELANIVSNFSDEESDNTVYVYVIEDKNQVLFRFNEIDLVSRMIDGQFPEYKQIIPTGYQTRAKTNRSDFQNALKVTNIIARNVLGNKIILEVNPKEANMTLSATQNEVGNNKSSFEASIEGEPITMAFSGRFIGDMIGNIGGDEILFECTTPVAPGVFKVKDDDSYIHLIMPMRL